MQTYYDAVVLDMDGVILDRGDGDWFPLVDQILANMFKGHDIDDDHDTGAQLYDDLYALETCQITGVEDRQMVIDRIEHSCETYSAETGQDINHRDVWETKEMYAICVQQEQIEAGERVYYDDVAVLEELHDVDLSLAVMSNNNHGFVEYVAGNEDLADGTVSADALDTYLDACYGIGVDLDEDRHRKPAPHYLEQAAADLGSENALYVGDSRCDIAAADTAGMDAVFVRRDHRRDYELNGHNPEAEIASLTELPDIVRYGPDTV